MEKYKTLVFLRPFTLKNPTLDQQNDFMIREIVNELECNIAGKFYTNDDLYGKDINIFIRAEIEKYKPEWVVAENESATVVLCLRNQKKILINPSVTYEDLNNVSEFSRENTWGFFDQDHEGDYERFTTVFPNVAFFPRQYDISLYTVKDFINLILTPDNEK